MRIRDWSSDVCSSDLPAVLARELTKLFETVLDGGLAELRDRVADDANQRTGVFVLIVEGAGDGTDARLVQGRRLYRRTGARRVGAAYDSSCRCRGARYT